MLNIFKKIAPFLFARSAQPVQELRGGPDDPEPPTLDESLHRLTQYEGMFFYGHDEEGHARFMHHSEQCGFGMNVDVLAPYLPRFQKCLDLLVDMKAQGVTDVDIPVDVVFHPISAAFTTSSKTKPTNRPVTMTFSCGEGTEYCFTKPVIAIDVLIEHWQDSLKQLHLAIDRPDMAPAGAEADKLDL